MRPWSTPLAFSVSAVLAAGCAQDMAVVDFRVRDATPAVPLRAIQTFELDERGMSTGSSFAWGAPPLDMPHLGSMGFSDQPPRFRLCAVALGESDDVVLSAVSDWVQPVLEQTVEVELTLAAAPDGEVPDPCGPELEPWPPDA